MSDTAVAAARSIITERYGRDFLPDAPRHYASKVKNAQEAHEAIRPAGESFKLPEQVARELATTDPEYFKWTQWIFLQIWNAWYDPEAGRARPISELEIPAAVVAAGDAAVRAYRDGRRLAYLHDAPVN